MGRGKGPGPANAEHTRPAGRPTSKYVGSAENRGAGSVMGIKLRPLLQRHALRLPGLLDASRANTRPTKADHDGHGARGQRPRTLAGGRTSRALRLRAVAATAPGRPLLDAPAPSRASGITRAAVGAAEGSVLASAVAGAATICREVGVAARRRPGWTRGCSAKRRAATNVFFPLALRKLPRGFKPGLSDQPVELLPLFRDLACGSR